MDAGRPSDAVKGPPVKKDTPRSRVFRFKRQPAPYSSSFLKYRSCSIIHHYTLHTFRRPLLVSTGGLCCIDNSFLMCLV